MTGPTNNIAANAASLYSQTSGLQGQGGSAQKAGETSFSDMVREGIRENIQTLEAGERASAQAITGEANIVDVVQAVNKAELTLNTVVALRDRMVQAYNDIMSMPI